MLSRVANNIYWLGRYIERAEDTARLIQVTTHLQLDLPKSVRAGWGSLIEILGAEKLFKELYEAPEERQVLKFLISDARNPGSIYGSLQQARENARTIRDIIPREAWEQINSLFQYARDESGKAVFQKHRYDILRQIVVGAQTITGVLSGTLLHDAGYQFFCMGRRLERADMTSRIVDVHTAGLVAETETGLTPFENIQWMSVLKSVTGYQMYRRAVQGPVKRKDVLSFLFKNSEFPRSVEYCLRDLEHCAWNLKRAKNVVAEARAVRLQLENNECSTNTKTLHRFVDEIQQGLSRINEQIRVTYFA
ncbi:MAG: alpha-E domain-containing protein [Gammaproteobacteria bacterium]